MTVDRTRTRRAATKLAALLAAFAVGGACTGDDEPDSVVLVVVDTLRADRLSLYGYDRDTTPVLDRRAETAVVFERAYSTSSWTLPAMASLLTASLPTEHGARRLPPSGADDEGASPSTPTPIVRRAKRFSPLAEDRPRLADALRDHGLTTAAFVTNPFMEERFGLAAGFDTYEYLPRRSTTEVVAAAEEWLDSPAARGRAFFLLLHLLEPHLPYDPAQGMRRRFSAGRGTTLEYPVEDVHSLRRRIGSLDVADRRFLSDAYDEEIATLDARLAALFEALDEREVWRRAVVVLTSDHGEELFEHDGFEHGVNLFDETMRVPLVVWAPGAPAGRRPHPVSLADVAPTLLEALGLNANGPLTNGTGVSRWHAVRDEPGPRSSPVLASGALHAGPTAAAVLWPWKVLHEPDGIVRVFDLEADPGELRPLSTPSAEATPLVGLVEELTRLESLDGNGLDLDSATRDRLRALGYLE